MSELELKLMSEWENQNECYWMNDLWVTVQMSEWMIQKIMVTEWVSELKNEWLSEWVNYDLVSEWPTTNK